MFKSFRIGSLFGIPVKLDVTFLLILPVFAWIIAIQIDLLVATLNQFLGTEIDVTPLTTGSMPWILGSVAAIALFGSVLLHEIGHSVVAIRYGFPIDSITLWLLGGVAQLTEQPTNWREELAIAIAGPVVSVGLGVIFYICIVVIPATMHGVQFLVAYLALMNVALAAFNMLPGFPMDGGRVLRALLARNQPFDVATQQAARVGKLFAVLLGLFGLLVFNIFLIAIAFFIYIAATGEARHTALRTAVEGIAVNDIMTPVDSLDVVTPDLTIDRLLELMFEQRHTGYPVVQNGTVVGIVTLEDVRVVPPHKRSTTAVEEVMSDRLETVRPEDEAFTALTLFQKNQIGRLIVLDSEDGLAGLITRTDIVTALNIGEVRRTGDYQDLPGSGPKRIETMTPDTEGPRW